MNNSTSERVVLGACPQALLVRAGPLRAPWDQPDSALRGLHAVRAGTQFEAAGDLTISPAYLPHLVDLALDLLIDQECGVWHLTSCGAIRHVNRARAIPRGAGPPADRVRSTPAGQLAWPPLRPAAASSAPAGGF